MKTFTLIALFGSAAALTLTKPEGGKPAGGEDKPATEAPEDQLDAEFEGDEEDDCFLGSLAEGLLDHELITEDDLEAAEEAWNSLDGEDQEAYGEEAFAWADADGSGEIDIEEGVKAFRDFATEHLGEEAAAAIEGATDDEIAAELKEYLGHLDEDGNGKLSRDEVGLPVEDDEDDFYGDYGYGDEDLEGEMPTGPKPEDDTTDLAQKGGKHPKQDGGDDEEESECFFRTAAAGLIEAGLMTEDEIAEAVEEWETLSGEAQGAIGAAIFDAVDTTDDGEISAMEAAEALMFHFGEDHEGFQGASVEEVAGVIGETFGHFDEDGSEALSVDEILGLEAGDDKDECEEDACFFEKAGAGLLEAGLMTADELVAEVAAFEAMTEEEQAAYGQAIFEGVDTSENGEIEPIEAANALMYHFGETHEGFQGASAEEVAGVLGEYFGDFDGDQSGGLSVDEILGEE
jgi:hypothetical protein